MAIGFASGILFFFLGMTGSMTEAAPRFMGWMVMVVPFLVGGIVLLASLRGRLPGTRPPPSATQP
jgi:hypothetical protein